MTLIWLLWRRLPHVVEARVVGQSLKCEDVGLRVVKEITLSVLRQAGLVQPLKVDESGEGSGGNGRKLVDGEVPAAFDASPSARLESVRQGVNCADCQRHDALWVAAGGTCTGIRGW